MASIGESEKRAYYPAMDLMRYVLSLAVILAHINELGRFHIPFPISSFEAVGGFFALSGFLMYPNYIRHNNFWRYAWQRARRILPPYIFIVLLAAFALVAVSSLPVGDYLCSGKLWGYLGANLTFLNWLQPSLPGVFDAERFVTPVVNGSLWTMKVEWCLYFSVPVFIALSHWRRGLSRNWLAVAVIVCSIGYTILFYYLHNFTGKEIFRILGRQVFGQLAYFYCGMMVYFFRDYLRCHLLLMFLAGFLLAWGARILPLGWYILNPIAITLMVMAISLIPREIHFLNHKTNISYEMYLFHFPIIQLSVFLGISAYDTWIEVLFVLIVTVLLSLLYQFITFHWHYR